MGPYWDKDTSELWYPTHVNKLHVVVTGACHTKSIYLLGQGKIWEKSKCASEPFCVNVIHSLVCSLGLDDIFVWTMLNFFLLVFIENIQTRVTNTTDCLNRNPCSIFCVYLDNSIQLKWHVIWYFMMTLLHNNHTDTTIPQTQGKMVPVLIITSCSQYL